MVALVGNKSDLQERREVETEVCLSSRLSSTIWTKHELTPPTPPQDAQRYADEEGLLFMETSAKTSENVAAVFEAIGGWSTSTFLPILSAADHRPFILWYSQEITSGEAKASSCAE